LLAVYEAGGNASTASARRTRPARARRLWGPAQPIQQEDEIVERICFTFEIYAGKEAEYKKRHDEICLSS
jgi:hypothetical protein